MSKDLIWDNPVLGTETYFHHEGEEIILETVQNADPIIEANKRALNDAAGRRFGDGKIVASIPMVVMMQLVQQGVLSPRFAVLDETRFRRWLNDPSNRYMRTFPGKI